MKKTKVIIPALGILLLSTAASVTGTVAWFSMNDTVTASGMSVTAKSDAAFLLIKSGENTATVVQGSKLTSDSAINGEDELFPVAHETINSTVDAEATKDAASGSGTVLKNWYFMYSDSPDSAAGNSATKQNIADFEHYVLKNQFSITVAKGSNKVKNLRVKTAEITTTGAQAVNCLVTCDGAEEFSGTGAAADRENPVTLKSEITDSTVAIVNVYIYWNGDDDDVYTNGISELKNTEVELTFTGDIVAA